MNMNTKEVIEYIKNSIPTTNALVYIQGKVKPGLYNNFQVFGGNNFYIAIGDLNKINIFLNENSKKIKFTYKNTLANRSKVALAEYDSYNARIEYGAIIRDLVTIQDDAVIMMGSVLNIGSCIGKNTMIDMNVVVGGRAIIGDNCHIGAGSVIAGVIEPPSKEPVIIGDNVFIGANCTILEGIKIGNNAVVGAGSVVTKDVEENTVVHGVPARVVKSTEEVDKEKIQIVEDLR